MSEIPKGYYRKDGRLYKLKEYDHICVGCNTEYKSFKKNQKYCSKSCGATHSLAERVVRDNNIFDGAIDTPDKAYMLGLIVTDGCITRHYNNPNKKPRIDITLKDEEFIREINKRYAPTKKVSYNRGCHTFRSNSQEDIAFLESIGIKSNKTYEIAFDFGVPSHLMGDYIRGLFDGDGCVYISKNGKRKDGTYNTYLFISFTTGSELMANELNDYLNSIGIESRVNIDSRRKDLKQKTYYIQIKKKASVKAFYDLMYNTSSTLFLSRKREVFESFYNDDIVD